MANTAPTGSTAKARRNRGRPSAPSDLDRQIDQRRDGTPVTVLDKLEETFRLGGSIEDAAARAGLARQTLYNWQRQATRLKAALYGGARTHASLTPGERDYLRFLDTVEAARADGKLLLLSLNDLLARGGIPITTTVEKSERLANGTFRVIERTTKTEETLPDGAAIRWRLERSWPAEFGRVRVELTGADGGPVEVRSVEERAATVADEARAFLMARAEAERTGS